jgi:signal transduction histidine kinase
MITHRKLFLFFAGLLISLNGVLAQTPLIDSLKKKLETHLQEDTARVNLLNNLAIEIRRMDRTQMPALVEEALQLAQKLNYKKGEGYALIYTALVLYDKYDFEESLKNFEKAKQILESIDDKNGLAVLLRYRGRMYIDEGKYAESLDDNLKAIIFAEEVGNIKLAIDVKSNVGYLYNVIGDYSKAIPYYTDALNQSKKIGYKTGMSSSYNAMGKTYKTQGNYPEALHAYQQGLAIDQELKVPASIAISYGNIGDVYERMGNYSEAFLNINRFLSYYRPQQKVEDRTAWGEWLLGKAFLHSGNADSGLYYGTHSLMLAQRAKYRQYLREMTELIAESAAKLKKYDTAYKYQLLSSHYKDSLNGEEITRKTAMLQANFDLNKKQAEIEVQKAENRKERAFLVMVLGGLVSVIILAIILFRNNRHKQKANLLLQQQKKEIDKKAGELAEQKDNLEQSYRNVELLGEIGRKITSSLSVETIISTVYDNVNSLMDASVFGIGIYHDDTKKIEFPATYENGVALPAYTNSVYEENRFASLCFISGKEIVMGDLQTEYKNFIQDVLVPKQGQQPASLIYLPLKVKEKIQGVITVQSFQKNAYTDYQLYMLRNIAIYAAIALENADSFKKLNQTVDSLKKTQTQLIQSEKMASLGELTAGIAHEIQNPLNFVNNFSEVNAELIDELEDEINKGNLDEIKSIAKDIKENEQKIIHHGKRADAIVKGMLLHSRSSSGQKELVDINALADEYLRLAYHGLRAKDKSFNASFKTNLDNNIDKVNIIPQDIGRVLVNLINNAFYAVGEKQKQTSNGYEPTVTVTTKKIGDKVELKVVDNGNGIPPKVLDKIFQPFFTTKPTGEGTGLGLSLSYDIITKGHGGELKVKTKEGEGSEFIIQIPAN